MDDNIKRIIAGADTANWKTIAVEFGEEFMDILVPPQCDILKMKKMPPLTHSANEISNALQNPIGSPTLPDIIRSKGKPPEELSVCVTVSDITRPAPYSGENGILRPLFKIIEDAGVKRENIVIVIGNGMHRPSSLEERLCMYGQDVVDNYRIVDHNCEDLSSQVLAAHTSRGTEVYLNKIFYDADIKITTGLVESHFMTGISGGRKAVCPALVNTKTIQKFHGVDFIDKGKAFASLKEKASAMLRNAVIYAAHHPRFEGRPPSVAFINEGPYAIPVVRS